MGAPNPFEKQTLMEFEGLRPYNLGDTTGDGGVPQPRSIEMHRQPSGATGRGDLPQDVQRPHGAAGKIVGVFQAKQLGRRLDRREKRMWRPEGGPHVVSGEYAVSPGQAADRQSGKRRRCAAFQHRDMCGGVGQHFVAGFGVNAQRHLVGHRAGDHEHGLVLA